MACQYACAIFIVIVLSSIIYNICCYLIPHDTIITPNNVTYKSNISSYEVFRNVSYQIMFDSHTEENVSFVLLGNKGNLTIDSQNEILNRIQLHNNNIKIVSDHQEDGCYCKGYGCSCCETLCVPEISLNDTACFNFAYLPNEYGIYVSLTIDGYAIINETISARNPPPLCMEPPFMDAYIHICVRFYDLDVANNKFHGCVLLEMKLFHVFSLKEWHLGCFDVGLVNIEHGLHMKELLTNTATNATRYNPSVKPSPDWNSFHHVLLSKMNSSEYAVTCSRAVKPGELIYINIFLYLSAFLYYKYYHVI